MIASSLHRRGLKQNSVCAHTTTGRDLPTHPGNKTTAYPSSIAIAGCYSSIHGQVAPDSWETPSETVRRHLTTRTHLVSQKHNPCVWTLQVHFGLEPKCTFSTCWCPKQEFITEPAKPKMNPIYIYIKT